MIWKHGFTAFWEDFQKEGFDPTTGETVQAARKRLRVEVELPQSDEFGAWMRERIG